MNISNAAGYFRLSEAIENQRIFFYVEVIKLSGNNFLRKIMTNSQLFTEISSLPSSLKQEVKDFVKSLKSKRKMNPHIKERKFGCAKGLFKIHPDFDEPLDDFKEYM